VPNCTQGCTADEGVDLVVDNGAQVQPPSGADDAPEGYEDLVPIDQGGFANVYRARDTRFDRTVALKILRSDSLNDRQLRRFRAECLATGRVSSHPNIVTVYDAGTTDRNRPWLAMEYCGGGSLADRLSTHGPRPVAEVISIGAHLCSALSAAHQAGILHRDVKPQNVLLTSYGEPALADFGIASVVIEDETVTETAAYTVVHAAPEILEGRSGTAATDIYSLGSTLYTLLAGHAPFAKEASIGLAPLVTRILSNDLPAIGRPGVPPELEQLLRWCMAAEPRNRPASAAELGVALTRLSQRLTGPEIPEGAPAPVPPARAGQRVSARRLLFGLGGALAVLVAAFTTLEPAHRPVAPAAAGYAPKNVVVTRGSNSSELIVSWTMPIRPDVVATVIYDGTGTKARAIVSYTSAKAAPQVTMRGLPSGQQVCLSAAHLVSLNDVVTNARSPIVCAVPR
jgi:tRNA A-37 threonylcarbamoyl transferase component Bud32